MFGIFSTILIQNHHQSEVQTLKQYKPIVNVSYMIVYSLIFLKTVQFISKKITISFFILIAYSITVVVIRMVDQFIFNAIALLSNIDPAATTQKQNLEKDTIHLQD